MPDNYTMEARLCDDDGLVSAKPVSDRKALEPEGTSYLDRINNWRWRMAQWRGEERFEPVKIPFVCTGNAHLIGEHIRCTSPAHKNTYLRQKLVERGTVEWGTVSIDLMATKELEEIVSLRQIGDQMQSAGSRLAEAVEDHFDDEIFQVLGYESAMALRELKSAIKQWTEARRKS